MVPAARAQNKRLTDSPRTTPKTSTTLQSGGGPVLVDDDELDPGADHDYRHRQEIIPQDTKTWLCYYSTATVRIDVTYGIKGTYGHNHYPLQHDDYSVAAVASKARSREPVMMKAAAVSRDHRKSSHVQLAYERSEGLRLKPSRKAALIRSVSRCETGFASLALHPLFLPGSLHYDRNNKSLGLAMQPSSPQAPQQAPSAQPQRDLFLFGRAGER
ncbi:hypothetical protein PG995_006917 [Apiospora arundinis]